MGASEMTTCDEIRNRAGLKLPKIFRLLALLLLQGALTILVGFAALFVDLQPVWSPMAQMRASSRPATRAPVRCC
jgi:hypothetical protein